MDPYSLSDAESPPLGHEFPPSGPLPLLDSPTRLYEISGSILFFQIDPEPSSPLSLRPQMRLTLSRTFSWSCANLAVRVAAQPRTALTPPRFFPTLPLEILIFDPSC